MFQNLVAEPFYRASFKAHCKLEWCSQTDVHCWGGRGWAWSMPVLAKASKCGVLPHASQEVAGVTPRPRPAPLQLATVSSSLGGGGGAGVGRELLCHVDLLQIAGLGLGQVQAAGSSLSPCPSFLTTAATSWGMRLPGLIFGCAGNWVAYGWGASFPPTSSSWQLHAAAVAQDHPARLLAMLEAGVTVRAPSPRGPGLLLFPHPRTWPSNLGKGLTQHGGSIPPSPAWPCREETDSFLLPLLGQCCPVLAQRRRAPMEASRLPSESPLGCWVNATYLDSGWDVVQMSDKVL